MYKRNPQLVYFSLFSISLLLICGVAIHQISRAGIFDASPPNTSENKKWFRPASTEEEIAVIDEGANIATDESDCLDIIEDQTSSRNFEVVLWKPEESEAEKAERLRQEQLADEQREIDEQQAREFFANRAREKMLQDQKEWINLIEKRREEMLAKHQNLVARQGNRKEDGKRIQKAIVVERQQPNPGPRPDPWTRRRGGGAHFQADELHREALEFHNETMKWHQEMLQKHHERTRRMLEQALQFDRFANAAPPEVDPWRIDPGMLLPGAFQPGPFNPDPFEW